MFISARFKDRNAIPLLNTLRKSSDAIFCASGAHVLSSTLPPVLKNHAICLTTTACFQAESKGTQQTYYRCSACPHVWAPTAAENIASLPAHPVRFEFQN
ncbi:hypothetical protein DEV91_101395 [Phyllobacterium brassicacearum]|nr:hypothetical protein DEV91_101395 [Phyllobacterium brassicacearum]